MPIDLYRIDDRLIHGQVIVGWGQPMDLGFVVLVDDEVAASDWERELYRMGVPPDVALDFASVDDAVARLDAWRADPRHGILVTGDIETMRHLTERAPAIREVNVGGIHHRPGRTERLRYLFLSAEEEQSLRAMEARGVTIIVRDVPSARPLRLGDLSGAAKTA
ncbi:MAG TPA: PTS sugar transporter subunit IIB [Gemmatimonadaceae bacterium]|nr:PTS sugar transporter subunit IIB [Gemmatimonadaceae bacterium]